MENINLIRKIAWSFHDSTREDWDDLFQEASLAYLEGLEKYNPSRGRISTFMWRHVSNHLMNYLKEEQKHQACSLDEISVGSPIKSNGYMESLSEDAQTIARIILLKPCKYSMLKPKAARWEIKRQLKRRGWSWLKIRTAIWRLKIGLV